MKPGANDRQKAILMQLIRNPVNQIYGGLKLAQFCTTAMKTIKSKRIVASKAGERIYYV